MLGKVRKSDNMLHGTHEKTRDWRDNRIAGMAKTSDSKISISEKKHQQKTSYISRSPILPPAPRYLRTTPHGTQEVVRGGQVNHAVGTKKKDKDGVKATTHSPSSNSSRQQQSSNHVSRSPVLPPAARTLDNRPVLEPTTSQYVSTKAIASPSISSGSSRSEKTNIEQRRKPSSSPELDLSSPELQEGVPLHMQEGQRGGRVNRAIGTEENESSKTVTQPSSSMSAQESRWWAMTFDELYKYAKERRISGDGGFGRKSGRVKIIHWLCEDAGITPFVAPTIEFAAASIAPRHVTKTGAISHPEAILHTTSEALQLKINAARKEYEEKMPFTEMLALAMSRSYQLFKDSEGKLPSKSKKALAEWLASWDVLKSDREKKWWLGDGIDLANKAKAMGFKGPAKGSARKYDVILWLRTTPEEAEIGVEKAVAQPTPITPPNRLEKRKAEEDGAVPVSKRYAKGSTRPTGWRKSGNYLRL